VGVGTFARYQKNKGGICLMLAAAGRFIAAHGATDEIFNL